MKTGGYITLAIGALISPGALFLMDTTVSMSSSLLGDVRSTHNIGLLQQQQLIVHLGFTLMIVGAIFAAVGSAMERRSTATVPSDAPPPPPPPPYTSMTLLPLTGRYSAFWRRLSSSS